jgi:diguanylate cyclase (GGDEF)-like protein
VGGCRGAVKIPINHIGLRKTMPQWNSLQALIMVWLALLASMVRAQPLLLDPAAGAYRPPVSYLEDRGGALSIDEVAVRRAEFTPAPTSSPSFGFTDSTYWFRLELSRVKDDRRTWFLEIGYPPLDSIELYWKRTGADGKAGFERIVAGDQIPFRSRTIHERQFVLPLVLPPGEARELFLRVRSAGAVTVPLTVLSDQELERTRGSDHLPYGLFFGTLMALALYNLLLFLSIRDVSYLYYVAYVVSAGLAFFGYNGLAFQFLWPDAVAWNQRAHVVFAFAALGFAFVFTRSFLSLAANSRLLNRMLAALAVVSGLFTLLSIWPLSFWASARIFVAIALPGVVTVLASGLAAWRRGYQPARWFLLAWTALLVGLTAYLLRFLNVLPGNLFTIYGVQIGSGLEIVLLSIALADRINVMKREKEQAQAALLEASQRSERNLEALVQERVREVHEVNKILRDEVSERRRAEEALFEMAHHDALTGLPNRLLLRDRFDVASAQTDRGNRILALLMMDLDGFKRVNDTLGHSIGDALLVRIAELIRECVRSSDTVARFGGDEFVVLLGSLRDAEEAAMVAEKIIAELAKPLALGEHQARVTPSIGVALYPQDASTMDGVLKCADAAMYRAKDAGGNTYYFFLEGAQRQLSLPQVRPE